jgi:type IV secretion system protein VirD4
MGDLIGGGHSRGASGVEIGVRGKENASVSAEWGEVWELGDKFPYGRDTPNGRRGIFLGYDGEGAHGRPVGFTDDRHVITIAGSRAGKGRSLIVPNMLLYEGSVLAIDPKGELARITSRARAEKGQRVFVLDPFRVSADACETDAQKAALEARFAYYNPLSELDPKSATFIDDAMIIASAMIKDGRTNDRFWADSARVLMHALIMYVFVLPEDDRNLCTVRDLLTLRGPLMERAVSGLEMCAQDALWQLLKNTGNDKFNGVVKAAGETFSTMHDNGVSSVLATARTETAFLDSPMLQSILRAPPKGPNGEAQGRTFKLGDMKRHAVTVYLCLPAGRMASHANWLRIFIDLAMMAFERDNKRLEVPLLMVLNEFPVLGYMRSLEAAAGQIAGFGVKLWTVIQDVTQLQRLYRETWETFVGNAGVVTAFANTDGATLKYLSERLGRINMDLVRPSEISAAQGRGGGSLTRTQTREDPLLAPQEIALAFERDKLRILVLVAGLPPLALQRALYDKGANFQGGYDQ